MQLEINNLPVDLPANTAGLIRLNKSVAALADLDTRTGEYSWPLTLPPTRRNAGIFALGLHPQLLDKFAGRYSFRLTAGGQSWQGVFELTGLAGGYTGQLVTAGFGWATALADKPLTALTSLAPVPYDGTQLAAILGQSCDETDLQFPLLSYGNFFTPPTLDAQGKEVPAPPGNGLGDYPLSVDDWLPSVYYRNVLRAVLREAGYYAAGAILEDEQVRQWCISAAGSRGDFWPWGALLPAANQASSPQTQDSYFEHASGSASTAVAAVGGNGTPIVRYFQPAMPTVLRAGGTRALPLGRPEFRAPTAGAYDFAWELSVSAASQFVDEQNNPGGVRYAPHFAPVVVGLVVFRGGEGYEGADGGICSAGTGEFTANQLRVVAARRLDTPGNFSLRTGFFSHAVLGLYLEPGDLVRLLLFTSPQYERRGDGRNKYTRKEFHLTTSGGQFACTAFAGPLTLNPAAVLPAGLSQKALLKDFLVRTNTVPLVDTDRRTVHLLSREAHRQVQGAPLDLSDYADPASLRFSPALGRTATVVFQPADGLAPPGTDAVRVRVGPGQQEQVVAGAFSAARSRNFTLDTPAGPQQTALPNLATAEEEATPRSESQQTAAGKAPVVVRYLGPHPHLRVPVGVTALPLGRSEYGGALAWDGPLGAVSARYRAWLLSGLRGHLATVTVALTPARYEQCRPGREVQISGAAYTIEAVEGYDPSRPLCPTTLTLLRLV